MIETTMQPDLAKVNQDESSDIASLMRGLDFVKAAERLKKIINRTPLNYNHQKLLTRKYCHHDFRLADINFFTQYILLLYFRLFFYYLSLILL